MTGLNIYLKKIMKVLYFQTLIKSENAVLVSIDGKITDIGALFSHVQEDFGCEHASICQFGRDSWYAGRCHLRRDCW